MPNRICFIGGTRYRRPLDATGDKKFRAMTSLGEIFVIGFSPDLRLLRFTEHAHFYALPQLPVPILRYLEVFILGHILIFWLILRHRIQVVVAQSPYEGFIAAFAIKVASWLGYRVGLAVEVHGDFEESLFLYRRVRAQRLYRFIMSGVARYAIERADVLRAISGSTKEQLKRWAPAKPIVQFSAWTDIETFLACGIDRKPDLPNTILYAGVLTPLKGIHHLINAFGLISACFADARLVIAGMEQNKGYAADLRKQIADLNLGATVHFTGPLPQSELARRMAGASVLVLPSHSEGFGRVVLEAMATGTPVIGSRVGGIPELLDDGVRGFLVPPGDERALAEKISWVFENRDRAQTMGQVAHAFAAQLFSTARYLQGYREIFAMAEQTMQQRENATSPF
ncbi:MAG TPA: glycosyltransferase [Candidatus Binatia bacterium]|nr:glycosyltransferase [Candidatus Binatia bacterium]